MNIGAVGNYGTETYYTGKASVGCITNEFKTNVGDQSNDLDFTSDGSIGAELYKGMSANDIFALMGEKGNSISTVNQMVTSKSPEDGKIYRTYFSDDKITCTDAEGTKIWDLEITEDQRSIVNHFFEGHKSYTWVKEIYSDDDMGIASSKDYWMELLFVNKSVATTSQGTETNGLSKLQEVQLMDNATVGISQNGAVTECTSVKENENKEKVWTITAFTENGIVSNKCQNGKIIDSWEIKYSNPNDAKQVQELLNFFDKDANLIFSGSKNFWEDFLRNNMSANDVISAHGEVFDKAAPNAPAIVKEAWMDAAKATGYLEGGKMNHISQLLIRQVINRENGVEDYQNVFGSSVASAMQAARELLYDLENPLTPISERGENAREYIEQEKEFYKKFIENLEEISNILVGDENNMHINKELAQKYSSQLKPVDDIAAVLKQPMQLASRKQLNKASNSIDIALGTNVKVPGGFTLVVKEYGVEVQGVTNWNNQKESQDASDMAGALATLLRNASGQLQHVGTDSRQITQWNEDVEKVLGYFGIDISRDFTVNGVKYVRDGSGIHKATAA